MLSRETTCLDLVAMATLFSKDEVCYLNVGGDGGTLCKMFDFESRSSSSVSVYIYTSPP